MITALIIMHFFGGGTAEFFSRSDFRAVDRTIEEPERAEAVTDAMERMNELLDSIVEKRRQVGEQLREIDHEVTSPEGTYDVVLEQLWQVRREAHGKFIEDVFVLRENLTRDEWETAFGIADE